jgi:hypothetical protein
MHGIETRLRRPLLPRILCSVFLDVSFFASSASAGALTPALLDGARL